MLLVCIFAACQFLAHCAQATVAQAGRLWAGGSCAGACRARWPYAVTPGKATRTCRGCAHGLALVLSALVDVHDEINVQHAWPVLIRDLVRYQASDMHRAVVPPAGTASAQLISLGATSRSTKNRPNCSLSANGLLCTLVEQQQLVSTAKVSLHTLGITLYGRLCAGRASIEVSIG